jgi:hypothetical protein
VNCAGGLEPGAIGYTAVAKVLEANLVSAQMCSEELYPELKKSQVSPSCYMDECCFSENCCLKQRNLKRFEGTKARTKKGSVDLVSAQTGFEERTQFKDFRGNMSICDMSIC